MNIGDFIDQYTESETAKIERKDVLQRFMNKTEIQTIALNLSNYEGAKESSPIRLPTHRGPRLSGSRRTSRESSLEPKRITNFENQARSNMN